MNISKKRILDNFSGDIKKDDPKKHDAKFYLEIYEGIKNSIPFKKPDENISLIRFLYAGCVKFNRFSVPTDFHLNHEYMLNKLSIFNSALIKAEGKITHNSVFFLLEKYRSELISKINEKSVLNLNLEDFDSYLKKVDNLPSFDKLIEKEQEYNTSLNILNGIMSGINDKTLKTTFEFRIPYILDINNLDIDFIWKDIPCNLKTTNTINPNNNTIITFDGDFLPVGATRWPLGETHIIIEVKAYIDSQEENEPMVYNLGQDNPIKWPTCFNYSYEILLDIFWKLKHEHEIYNNLIPIPRDLSDIKVVCSSSLHDSIVWMMKQSPASTYRIVPKIDSSPVKYTFSTLQPLQLHLRYRISAQMYLEFGMLNEALFWLNAGIESFFEYKFKEFSSFPGNENLLLDLQSPKAHWQSAEEIIVQQFPDLKDKIIWPEENLHNSMFTKLKYLANTGKLTMSKKEILAHYSTINKYRNDIFHGRSGSNINIDKITPAFNSYDFILVNFNLSLSNCSN